MRASVALLVLWLLAACAFADKSEEPGESDGESETDGEGSSPSPGCGDDGIVRGDDIALRSQADVEALAGCTGIEGALRISGDDIVDLGALSGITSVGRSLTIIHNPSLVTLAGLEALETTGWGVTVFENPGLESLEGLSGLVNAGWGLEIEGNPRLESLVGLEGVSETQGYEGAATIRIRWNDALASLDGLEGLAPGDGSLAIFVASNRVLSDISALTDVEVLDSIRLQSNPALTDLSSLSSLRRASVSLEDTAVASLEAFGGLVEAEFLTIYNNPYLRDLSGFESLETVGSLAATDNPVLTTLGALSSLRTLDRVSVAGNRLLTSLGTLALGGGDMYQLMLVDCPALADISSLGPVTHVDDLLVLEGLSALTSLDALGALASVERTLKIINNEALPQADAEAWAATRGARETKVDGNLGAEPHTGDCPWVGDLECDDPSGTGLCPEGTDPDCNPSGGG